MRLSVAVELLNLRGCCQSTPAISVANIKSNISLSSPCPDLALVLLVQEVRSSRAAC
jgi:hypothetical protein